MAEIIHKELSYAVRGVLFDVHNQLGPLLPEKFYQEAVAIGLEAKGIICETEKQFPVQYCGVEVGRYFVDVWVEGGKLLLELKVAPEILPIHRAQAISYLKVTDADLALGPGFLHQVYRRATMVELREKGIGFQYIKETPVFYQDIELGKHETRLILVEDNILVAAFAVRENAETLKARLRSQLRRQDKELGIWQTSTEQGWTFLW